VFPLCPRRFFVTYSPWGHDGLRLICFEQAAAATARQFLLAFCFILIFAKKNLGYFSYACNFFHRKPS
jgi:hypothetical protein